MNELEKEELLIINDIVTVEFTRVRWTIFCDNKTIIRITTIIK